MDDLAVLFDASIHQGFSGSHGDLPEVEIDAQFLQCAMHKIPVADGSAADSHQNVDAALQAIGDCLFDFGGIIWNDPLSCGVPLARLTISAIPTLFDATIWSFPGI